MSRKKLVSHPLGKLNKRILGLKSIDAQLVLKNGLSVDTCTITHNKLQVAIDDLYLTAVLLDEKRQAVKILEKEANALSKNVLTAVINDYGDDSIHVSKIGGVRTSERAKPVSKAVKAEKAAEKAAKKAAKNII